MLGDPAYYAASHRSQPPSRLKPNIIRPLQKYTTAEPVNGQISLTARGLLFSPQVLREEPESHRYPPDRLSKAQKPGEF